MRCGRCCCQERGGRGSVVGLVEEVGTDEIKRVWFHGGGWPEAGSASFGRLRARCAKEEMGWCGKWRDGQGMVEDGSGSSKAEEWLGSGRRFDWAKLNVGRRLKSRGSGN